jgi:hypothetical protein
MFVRKLRLDNLHYMIETLSQFEWLESKIQTSRLNLLVVLLNRDVIKNRFLTIKSFKLFYRMCTPDDICRIRPYIYE